MSPRPPRPAGVVGPNAITQLAAVLRERRGEMAWRAVLGAAGLAAYAAAPPERMTAEGEAAALHRAVMVHCPADWADMAAEAGDRTARYLLAHRIPPAAQRLMRWLPAALAARVLVAAIARNAWTFAGSGRFTGQAGWRGAALAIADNPLAMPGCPWHRAVFARLFATLVTPRAVVSHEAGGTGSGTACRFLVRWD